MMTIIIFLFIEILLEPSDSVLIPGSLSNPWTSNVTMYLNQFDGVLLYFADNEENILKLHKTINDKQKNIIEISFNQRTRYPDLKEFCGCDPCHGKMMTLIVNRIVNSLEVSCNGISVIRIFLTGDNEARNVSKQINISIGQGGSGCLDSFYYNNQMVKLDGLNPTFKTTCAGHCKDLCHSGECRPSKDVMPVCDCSSTALNGPYCNNSLRPYNSDSHHSYQKIDGVNKTFIKLSWKGLTDKKYCLLEFTHEYGQITFSFYRNYLWQDEIRLSDITAGVINFISVTIRDESVTINVNNKKYEPLIIIGKLNITVGIVTTKLACATFQGQYDFIHDPSHFRIIDPIKETRQSDRKVFMGATLPINAILTNDTMLLNNTILSSNQILYQVAVKYFGFGFILLAVLVTVTVIIIVLRRRVRSKKNVDVNVYYDPDLTIVHTKDLLEPSQYDELVYEDIGREINYIPKRETAVCNVPPLPPRHF